MAITVPKGLQMSLCTIDRGRLHQQHLLLEGQEVREGDQQFQNRTILGWVEAFDPWEMEKWIEMGGFKPQDRKILGGFKERNTEI